MNEVVARRLVYLATSMRSISICLLYFLSHVVCAQAYVKSHGEVEKKRYSYYIMKPAQSAKGIVLLMPSRGEVPKKLFWHTAIPRHLAAHGFVIVVPQVDYALMLTDKTKNILDHVVASESAKAGLTSPSIVIGGFSSGGAIAASYAAYKLSKDEHSVTGVFLIDPPLDLERFYNAWVPLINSQCPEIIVEEGKFIKKYIEQLTGGSPTEMRGNYLKYSAFTASDSLGGNAQFLKYIPIRLYTEPDLDAMKAKYCPALSYQNLNSADLDALRKLLTKLGNRHVEYIKTEGRGLHSWNIVDPEDLALWASKLVSK